VRLGRTKPALQDLLRHDPAQRIEDLGLQFARVLTIRSGRRKEYQYKCRKILRDEIAPSNVGNRPTPRYASGGPKPLNFILSIRILPQLRRVARLVQEFGFRLGAPLYLRRYALGYCLASRPEFRCRQASGS
jgi:hypothetical protein